MCKAMREWAAEERALGHIAGHTEGRAEGRAEGHAEGRAEGHAEGRVKGHAEGRQEAIIENANSLFEYGMGIEEVAAALKLKLDSVKAWYDEWKKRTVGQATVR